MYEEEDICDEVYEVEAIIGEKIENNIILYEVKWVGYDETTHEPLENLAGCLDLVKEYEISKANKKSKEEQKKQISVKKESKPMTREEKFVNFARSRVLAVKSHGFLQEPRINTSAFDKNWYTPPPKVKATTNIQISRIVNDPEKGKRVYLIDYDTEREYEYDYDTIVALFPRALLRFAEKCLFIE